MPHRIAIVLVPGFSFLSLPLVTEPLFIANWITGKPLFTWHRLSVDGLAVATSSGTPVPVDAPLGQSDTADTVLVLASFQAREAAEEPRLLAWLRRMARTGATLGAVETGSEILAAAGLLDGEQAAVHWYNIEGFRERYPAVQATAGLYSRTPRRMTSAGATATLDLMLDLVAREAGSALATEVADHLLVDGPRAADGGRAGQAMSRQTSDLVAKTLAIMEETVSEPLSSKALADRVGLSLRQLQRRIRQKTGRSVAEAYRTARLERAHQLVQQTNLSLTEISAACGFGGLESFSRCYRRAFGVPASLDRSQSVKSTVLRRATRL
jgi:AraC family transcriptional regulator, carnitine catabolism transcriptional activator